MTQDKITQHVAYLKGTLIPDLKAEGMHSTAVDFELNAYIIESLNEKVKRMERAMDGIRFVAFKHAESYWNDANGTDEEKLDTVVALARESNWGYLGSDSTDELVKKHK